jgi:hypothetical protein
MTMVIGCEGKSSAEAGDTAGSAQANVAAASAAIILNFMVERPRVVSWFLRKARMDVISASHGITWRQCSIACGIQSTRPFAATRLVG